MNDNMQPIEGNWDLESYLKQKNDTLVTLIESFENVRFQVESLIEAADSVLKDKDDEIEKLNEYFDKRLKE